jgi:predicted RNA-binding protein YlxR (DUF448 family)
MQSIQGIERRNVWDQSCAAVSVCSSPHRRGRSFWIFQNHAQPSALRRCVCARRQNDKPLIRLVTRSSAARGVCTVRSFNIKRPTIRCGRVGTSCGW